MAMEVERERQDAASLLQRTERLIERTERLLEAAERDGKVSAALAAVAQLRGLLELLGKASGELATTPTVTINYMQVPEVVAAFDFIRGELSDLPDRRERIAVGLKRLQLEAGPTS